MAAEGRPLGVDASFFSIISCFSSSFVVSFWGGRGGSPYDGHFGFILQPPSFGILVVQGPCLQNKLEVSMAEEEPVR